MNATISKILFCDSASPTMRQRNSERHRKIQQDSSVHAGSYRCGRIAWAPKDPASMGVVSSTVCQDLLCISLELSRGGVAPLVSLCLHVLQPHLVLRLDMTVVVWNLTDVYLRLRTKGNFTRVAFRHCISQTVHSISICPSTALNQGADEHAKKAPQPLLL